MKSIINPNIDRIGQGFHKKWIWETNADYNLSCNYLQKINYSIQDFNREITGCAKPTMKELVYLISLVDWIIDSIYQLRMLVGYNVLSDFSYKNENEVLIARNYLKALRSFIVAHPLNTSDHPQYGFDGKKICIDIRNGTALSLRPFTQEDRWYHLTLEGLIDKGKDMEFDIIIMMYGLEKDEYEFYQYIGLNLKDLASVFIA